MEKKKLISTWSSIKKAWSELTDNSSLGFSLKAGTLFFVSVIVLMIPVFAVFSLVENNKRDVIAPQGVSTEYFEYPSATWDVTPAPTKVSTNPILSVVLSVVGNVFSLVVCSASSIIFIFISLGVHKKDFPSIKNLLTQAFKKAPKFVGMSLLCGLITGVGFLLLIIPGIMLTIRLMFAPFILILENTSIKDALRRSGELTKGYRFALFGRILTLYLFFALFLIPFLFMSFVLGMSFFPLLTILVILVSLNFYEDLKSIKAGEVTLSEVPKVDESGQLNLDSANLVGSGGDTF